MWYHADMIHIGGSEQVNGFGRPDVFRAGVLTENWPEVGGLTIAPREEVVTPATNINVGLAAAGLNIELDGTVTRFVPDTAIDIEGQLSLARARISIRLEDGKDGTLVGYDVQVEPRKLYVRLAEVAVREFLKGAVPRFAQEYRRNVADYLEAETSGLRLTS